MNLHLRSASALALLWLAACAAPNPSPSNEPAAWRPPAEPKAQPKTETPAAAPEAAKQKDTAAVAQVAATATPAAANPAVANPAAAPATVEPIVARVGGQPVYVSELLAQWLYLDNFRVLDQLRNLAMSRLVLAEAKRLNISIDADRSSRAYENAVAAIENEIRGSEIGKKSPNMTLDAYVERVMGLDPIRYRERLRDDALRALLGERVARAWLLQQEHAEIHVIVVGSEEAIKAAQKDIADGKAFEDVAKARSIDPSKKDGGAITPIVRGLGPASKAAPLAQIAFETEIGAVGGPISDSGAWLLVRVDARPKPIEGDWLRVGPLVEESLKKRPVDPLEVKQWHSAMSERYEVDLRPFLDLVHEPVR